ncbi:MAG TPA: Uma2 family endonuclease, partial [Kofleriaceae bacterium]
RLDDMDVAARDHVVVMRGVSWETYLQIDHDRGGDKWPRLAFLDGELEIASPHGREHELRKTLMARFLEAFAEERGVSLNGFGNTTFADKARQAGLEPDVCYYVGDGDPPLDPPHLALEVAITSGGVDKLEIYRRFGVREVWFWKNDALVIYQLRADGYALAFASALLPALDIEAFSKLVRTTNPSRQTEAVRAYRTSLRATGG